MAARPRLLVRLEGHDLPGPGRRWMFRRARIPLSTVPPATLAEAVGRGRLVGRLGLTDGRGNPRGAVDAAAVAWSAG